MIHMQQSNKTKIQQLTLQIQLSVHKILFCLKEYNSLKE